MNDDVRIGDKLPHCCRISNIFMTSKISLISEIGNICKKYDVDAYDVADPVGLDDRIGAQFLRSGIGFWARVSPRTRNSSSRPPVPPTTSQNSSMSTSMSRTSALPSLGSRSTPERTTLAARVRSRLSTACLTAVPRLSRTTPLPPQIPGTVPEYRVR